MRAVEPSAGASRAPLAWGWVSTGPCVSGEAEAVHPPGGRTRSGRGSDAGSGAPHNGLASAFFDLLIMLGWNSVWRRACLVRWSLRMKRFSHSGQRNCFSPVWVR